MMARKIRGKKVISRIIYRQDCKEILELQNNEEKGQISPKVQRNKKKERLLIIQNMKKMIRLEIIGRNERRESESHMWRLLGKLNPTDYNK